MSVAQRVSLINKINTPKETKLIYIPLANWIDDVEKGSHEGKDQHNSGFEHPFQLQQSVRGKLYQQVEVNREVDAEIFERKEPNEQPVIDMARQRSPKLMTGIKAYYETKQGKAFLGDTLELIKKIPDNSINLIVTSPPYGLRKKKEYGNADPEEYVNWFMPFAREFRRVLTSDGSFVLNIGGGWEKGLPTRSLYQFELLLKLCKEGGFHLAEEFIWHKPAALPTPAEWVTIRRIRVKDSIEYIWWLSKTPYPKANNKNVLQPYSESMRSLLKKGYIARQRPSGHKISTKFQTDNKGAIPPNFLQFSNTESNSHYLRMCAQHNIKPHPARYPTKLPEFFVKFLTEKGDIILDPFAGSNVSGEVAEQQDRYWLAFELNKEYLDGSKFRFNPIKKT